MAETPPLPPDEDVERAIAQFVNALERFGDSPATSDHYRVIHKGLKRAFWPEFERRARELRKAYIARSS